MKKSQRPSEKGQALVLLVLGAVVLLGFTALAVDGGMVYSDRRQAQTAADASSLAGGGAAAIYMDQHGIDYTNWSCTGAKMTAALTDAHAAALQRANDNKAWNEPGREGLQGVKVNVTCNNDPPSVRWYGRYIDVSVVVSNTTSTAFAHFVFPGLLQNTVNAVTRVRPRTPLALGYAIVGLNQAACSGNQNGVLFSGSSGTYVNGGGVFSNGCMTGNGSGFEVYVTDGTVNYVRQLEGNASSIHPYPAQIPEPMPESAYDVPPPDCDQVPSRGRAKNVSGKILPGRYTEISLKGEAQLEAGGLYCLSGDFDTGNSNLWIDTSNGKQGVTIYLKTGSFITSGNGHVNLSAPPSDPNPYPALPGILIYMDPSNAGVVRLRGNSASSYLGVVLAPGGTITAAGTTDIPDEAVTFHTQLIGKNVDITGNARIDINYNGSDMLNFSPKMDLLE